MSEQRKTKKELLENRIESISESLSSQLDDKKELAKNIAIISAIVVAGYALVKLLTDTPVEDEEAKVSHIKSEESSILGGVVRGAITSLLLTVIKSKLNEFLEETKERE